MKAVAWAKRAAAPIVWLLDNPILLKELRAGMRGARYFAAFMAVLSIVGAVLLIVFAVTGASGRGDPAMIGAGVFSTAIALNLIVAFLVVPSFGATSITSERERQTYDILMSTTLTARQIVWGKLLGSLAQVGAIFLSTIPIVGLTFLFGGVTVRQMVAAYMTLFAVCVVLSAWAISISASSHTSQRAVASAYGGAILFFFILWALMAFVMQSRIGFAFAETYGLAPDLRMFGGMPSIDPWVRILYVYLVPAYLFFSFVTLLLLNAATRLKSPFDEKSPAFRIYFLAVTGIGLAIAHAIFVTDIASQSSDERMVFFMTMAFLSFLVGSVSCIFAAETAVTPYHIRERYVSLTGWRRWRWILLPGSQTGALFCLAVNILLAGVAVVLFQSHTEGFDRGSWVGHPPQVPFFRAVTVVMTWTVLISGIAAWLVTVLPGRPRTMGVIVVLLILAMCAIPMIHWSVSTTVSEQNMYAAGLRSDYPGPITLVLSPIAGIWTSLSLHHDGIRTLPLDVKFFGAELPLHATQAILFLGAGVLFHVLAGRRRAALLKRLA